MAKGSEVFLRKTTKGWRPADEESKEISDSFSVGDVVKTKMSKPRNYEHHKKAFALFNAVLDNHETYETIDQVLDEIKFRLGYLNRWVIDGKAVFKLKSISFSAMGQEKFNKFYSGAIDVILKYMIPGTDKGDFENYILSFT